MCDLFYTHLISPLFPNMPFWVFFCRLFLLFSLLQCSFICGPFVAVLSYCWLSFLFLFLLTCYPLLVDFTVAMSVLIALVAMGTYL
ncbi:hypothetical protein BDF14DRAFT_1842687 [Spinellus fusiger]|nr:hypothetical protein BDF14DRAFT_1842687 [Spinellus fusiger]